MKRFCLVALCCIPVFAFCQDITGVWKGTLYNDSTQQAYQYEVVISKTKGKYTAFSHTWFVLNNKKYYGIKKINVRIAKDGKIVMQDEDLVENNYPTPANKNVIQLNVLDLAITGADATLDGLFVTNRSKAFNALTGKIHVSRVSPLLAETNAVEYFKKQNNEGNEITAVR
jgi:hypothetical protein